jgi:hypothetical protein
MIDLTLDNILIILGIISPIGIAIAFFVRLHMKVGTLEELLKNHPLLAHYEAYQKTTGVFNYYDDLLKSSRVEKLDD